MKRATAKMLTILETPRTTEELKQVTGSTMIRLYPTLHHLLVAKKVEYTETERPMRWQTVSIPTWTLTHLGRAELPAARKRLRRWSWRRR